MIVENKKSIPLAKLIGFNLKLYLKDKSIIILSFIILILTLFFSILISVYKKSNTSIILFYNYFFIITFSVLLFLLILRMVQLMLNNKIDDKTIYLMISTNISRKKIIFTLVITNLIYLLAIQTTIFLLPNIFLSLASLKVNEVLLRITLVHFIYALCYGFCLTSFFIFLSTTLKMHVSTILCSLILATNFINSLPTQFMKESEKSIVLSFEGGQAFQVTEIYKAFDLQEHIKKEQIKYPLLSKYINNFFIENELLSGQSFQTANIINLRKQFWKNLGLINSENKNYSLTNQTLAKVPDNWSKADWKVGDQVDINFSVEDTFITRDELIELSKDSNNENQNILMEFLNFMSYINKYFINDLTFQKNFYQLFDDFPSIVEGSDVSYIQNKTSKVSKVSFKIETTGEEVILGAKNNLTSELIKSMYTNYLGRNTSGIALSESPEMDTLINSEEGLFSPVMLTARILEDYFIKYCSIYTIATTKAISLNKSYFDYQKARTKNELFFQMNFIANNLLNFTYYAKNASEGIWFNEENTSVINFNNQDNSFLPYKLYSFKINKNELGLDTIDPLSYNNFIPPYIYLIIQLTFAIINLFISILLLNRKDLN
ncbi:hypothetical protein [Spiroplasma endosymbiont of Dioctria linearis]|uniref:hypothetical protein n=1 Tax=Spiroplasma endosymbiont of Dioctria linearis TaxID=3066290 RepID=UPI00313A79D5